MAWRARRACRGSRFRWSVAHVEGPQGEAPLNVVQHRLSSKSLQEKTSAQTRRRSGNFPERGLVWADIFSCKDFDAEPVLEDFKRRFKLQALDVRTLERNWSLCPAVALATP